MLRKLFITLALILFTGFSFSVSAQMAEHRAKFISSMLRHINWPTSENSTFKIAVYGSFEDYRALAEETLGKSYLNKNIEIVNLAKLDHLAYINPQILLLATGQSNSATISQSINLTSKSPTLIMSCKDGSIRYGAGINFFETNDKLAFELSIPQAQRNGIQLSKQIINYAQKVH